MTLRVAALGSDVTSLAYLTSLGMIICNDWASINETISGATALAAEELPIIGFFGLAAFLAINMLSEFIFIFLIVFT